MQGKERTSKGKRGKVKKTKIASNVQQISQLRLGNVPAKQRIVYGRDKTIWGLFNQ